MLVETLSALVLLALPQNDPAQTATPRHPARPDLHVPTGRSGVVVVGLPHAAGIQPLVAQGSPRSHDANATQDPARPQNETTIALDPLQPLNLVAGTNDYRNGDTDAGLALSFDGGLTWSASTLASLNGASAKYSTQGDPSLAAYPGGTFYYAYIDFNRNDDQNRLCVARSTDGGATWPQVGVVIDHSGGGSHDFEDKELLAVDTTGGAFDGNVYVAWTRFPASAPNRVMFSRSTDGGTTYSSPAQISDFADGGYQGTSPVVGPNGTVYVAFYHFGTVQIDKSTDGGATFGADVTVAPINDISSPIPGSAFRTFSFPNLAVDRSGTATDGNLYVVWADESGPTGDPDILFTRSLDGGASWSTPIRVSDDTNAAYQFMPAIAVSPDGTITVSFSDERAAPGTGFYDVYITQSFDGGQTFRRNARINREPSDSSMDGFSGTFIGDYTGIAASNTLFAPYWTDCRPSNGNAEGYVRALRMRRP